MIIFDSRKKEKELILFRHLLVPSSQDMKKVFSFTVIWLFSFVGGMGFQVAVSLVMILMVIGRRNGEQCHPNDHKGLMSFKAGIRHDRSDRLKTWIGNGCCSWDGIVCDNTTRRVTELNLPGFYTRYGAPYQTTMEGNLSPSITLLSHLEVIDLGELHFLNGKIPPFIGNLSKLRKLYLYENDLSGPIPESISKLSNLEHLFLQVNSFSGSLPLGLGNLKCLRRIDLHSNQISGPIPEGIGNLALLEELDLSDNSVTGKIPVSMTNLSSLRDLYLDTNQLEGVIPFPLAPSDLSSLGILRLDDNHLTGTLPSYFWHLTSLQRISMVNNRLEGSIPSSLGNLRNLQDMYLSGNRFSGKLPTSIGQLSELRVLNVSHNMIHGQLPNEMGSLRNLQILDLSFNRFNLSSIPRWLEGLQSLYKVYLAGCGIQGKIPDSLQTFGLHFSELDLSDNHLVGELPEWLGRFRQLEILNLSLNSISSKIPSTITRMDYLRVLDLHSNRLSGPLIWSGSLAYIDLSDNKFSGGLEQIDRSGEQGIIEYLNISRNSLKGEIPFSIGKLQKMETLDVSYNQLSSTLPASLSNATSLERLKLQKNHFTGTIPSQFLKLRKLREFNVSDNSLVGKIPDSKPFIDFPVSSYSGNRGLCGKPMAPCRA